MGRRTATWSIAPLPEAAIETMMPLAKIPLKGEHNVENVLAAVCAARLAGVAAEAIRRAIENFQGRRASPGVRGHHQRRGVLQRLQGHQRGRHRQGRGRISRRHSPHSGRQGQRAPYYSAGAARCASGCAPSTPSARRRPKSSRSCAAWFPSTPAKRWPTRSNAAAGAARPGEVVLLAPACSSFDQFENYEHRGRVFKQLVGERLRLESAAERVGVYGKTCRRRQMAVLHHAGAGGRRAGDGLLRLRRRGSGALSLGLHLRRHAGHLGRGGRAGSARPHARGHQPLQLAALHLSRAVRHHAAAGAGLFHARLAPHASLDSLRRFLHLPAL